jgi:hypothetical protein
MLSNWLDKTAIIQSKGTAKGTTGGVNPSWTDRLTGIACAVWPADARTLQQFGIQDVVNGYVVATQIDIDATANDRVVVEGRNYSVLSGCMRFSNARISSSPLFTTLVQLRNQ